MDVISSAPSFDLTDADHVLARIDGEWASFYFSDPIRPRPEVVFPGAFNPVHVGHKRIAAVAASLLGQSVDIELSATNVDKRALSAEETVRRAAQFPLDRTLWITLAPTYVMKARIFDGATFLIGADTAVRIADPKYYGQSRRSRDDAIAEISDLGCRFLVFGRVADGRFLALAELQLPETMRRICDEVPEELFREDVSSTQLRRQQSGR